MGGETASQAFPGLIVHSSPWFSTEATVISLLLVSSDLTFRVYFVVIFCWFVLSLPGTCLIYKCFPRSHSVLGSAPGVFPGPAADDWFAGLSFHWGFLVRSTPVCGQEEVQGGGLIWGDSLAGMNIPQNTLSLQSWGVPGVIRHTESFMVSQQEWISFHRTVVK